MFSREKLAETTKAISDRLGNEGYAFANVNAVPELDKDKRTVAFTFFVDPGRRVYVRRINIAGNTQTRDEVIRREMRQLEGGWYSAQANPQLASGASTAPVLLEVNVETPAVPGTTDQVDVNVNVDERPTGRAALRRGFSAAARGSYSTARVSQPNIFGTGKHVSVGLNTGKVNKVYSLSYLNPYYTVDGVEPRLRRLSRSIDASNTLASASTARRRPACGDAFRRPGHRIDTRQLRARLRTHEARRSIRATAAALPRFREPVRRAIDAMLADGAAGRATPATASSGPRKGTAADGRASEVALPGDLTVLQANYQNQRYFPALPELTLLLNGEIGYGGGYGGKPAAVLQELLRRRRGLACAAFESFTLGPQDINGNPRRRQPQAAG